MSGALCALLTPLTLAACSTTLTPTPQPTHSVIQPGMTAAQAYDAVISDTGFKWCRDYCGPQALVATLNGVKSIHFPTSMSADVASLEQALAHRAGTVALTTLPPGDDGGRAALDSADAKVRADLALPTPAP